MRVEVDRITVNDVVFTTPTHHLHCSLHAIQTPRCVAFPFHVEMPRNTLAVPVVAAGTDSTTTPALNCTATTADVISCVHSLNQSLLFSALPVTAGSLSRPQT